MRKPPSSLVVRLAVAQQARREAIYDARVAQGDRPSSLPSLPPPPRLPRPRASLPSVDELIGPEAPKARWKLALAVGSALVGLVELVRQVAGLVGKH
jgi:hypothetical protein